MLLELYPPDSSSLASTAFNVHLAFSDLQHGLSTPLAWTAQLSTLLHSELDLPTQQHMLDRAVGVGALLEGVRVEILKDEASDELGVRVHCQFADFTSVDWCIPAADCGSEEARRFVCALEAILGDIQAMRAEEEKFKMAVELEEQRREVRHTTRHQHTQSMEPVSVGRKWAHKRQKSFLQSIVSAVGSMMSQRSSPATQPILPTAYPNDYPFPLSPSPSPPLSPPYTSSPNPSRSGTPSPDPSSCSSVANQHGHAPHTYAYGSQHAAPLPPNPWSPPSRSPIPLSPQSVHSWGSLSFSTQHQIRLEGHRRRITAAMVDTYRRFILGALVFGFAKEVGLVSDNSLRLPGSGHTSGSQTLAGSPLSEGTIVPDAMTSSTEVLPRPSDVTPTQPPSPYTGPARASSNAPTTYNYRLWVLRSMLRSMEAEVREIVESCEASVKEDYLRAQAQAQDEEDEVDISDGNIDVSGLDVPPRSATTSVFPSPASPAVPSFGAKHKVSFDSSKSMRSDGGSPKKGEKVVEKKRSRGKLVKKKSLVWRGSSASEGEGESTKGKEKGGVLGIIGSWGRSKTNVSTPSVISPIVEDDSEALSQQPTFSSTPAQLFSSEPEDVAVDEGREAGILDDSLGPQDQSLLSPTPDVDGGRSASASRRESYSSSGCTSATSESSSGSMATTDGCSIVTQDTGITTPATSELDLPGCEGLGEGEEEMDIGADAVYSTPSRSKSTLDILDQLGAAATSSSSLLLPLDNAIAVTSEPTPTVTHARRVSVPIPDINTPDFQWNLRMRLNLHPAHDRLTHRITKLREMLVIAEAERRDAREEEERYLDQLEVKSRRRAWANKALGRSSPCHSRGSLNLNSDLMLLGLSTPPSRSLLGLSSTGWTSEDMEREGLEYVAPKVPHPLFHGFVGVGFPRVPELDVPGGSGLGPRRMRKVDIRMRMDRERERRKQEEGLEVALDCENAFGVRSFSVVDDRDEDEDDELDFDACAQDVPGVVEFCLDASWNTGPILDSDDSDEELELDIDESIFGSRKQKLGRALGNEEDDFLNLDNIPPRPGVTPAKNSPPSRLFVVAEEDELDDPEGGSHTAGTGTETETDGETEGEGDEFEFDNTVRSSSRRPSPRKLDLHSGNELDGSEDEDDAFFADIHDITDIVGDIEDGLGRHQRYPSRRRHRRSSKQSPTSPTKSSESRGQHRTHRPGLDLHRGDLDALDGVGVGSPVYPLHPFDVDVEMGLGAGAGLIRASALEFQEEEEERHRRRPSASVRSVKGRPRTPYPDDDEASELQNQGSDAVEQGSGKRPRNHKRQWQTMLSSSSKARSQPDELAAGIEVALEPEKPKQRFMPAVKNILGRKSRRAVEASSHSAEPVVNNMHPAKPRARTTSMYQRQPSPNSRAGLASRSEHELGEEDSITLDAVPAGKGLPLGIGFGYGSYSIAPPSKSPKAEQQDGALSESSLLCQPVCFTSPASPTTQTRLAIKTLAASPPTFTSPPPPATKARLHQRSVMLSLDLDGASVEHFELAGSDGDVRDDAGSSATSSVWGSCGHSPGCESACSSASLPMTPLHSPSPTVAIASSSNSSVVGSPVIQARAVELEQGIADAVTSVVGQFVVAQDPLRQPVQQSKKFFHLPSSLSLSKERLTDEEEAPVDVEVVVKEVVPALKKSSRKSVLADPSFFSPPTQGC